MKDQELFDLCTEVYERTGWEADDWWGKSAYSGEYRVVPDKNYSVRVFADEGDAGSFYDHLPHYTSDYLLEKLPRKVAGSDLLVLEPAWDDGWNARYPATPRNIATEFADTPLKALLKLTLALHEAGELTKPDIKGREET